MNGMEQVLLLLRLSFCCVIMLLCKCNRVKWQILSKADLVAAAAAAVLLLLHWSGSRFKTSLIGHCLGRMMCQCHEINELAVKRLSHHHRRAA